MLSSGPWISSFEPGAAQVRPAPTMGATMFGHQGGESQKTVTRKIGYRDEVKLLNHYGSVSGQGWSSSSSPIGGSRLNTCALS
jgi:hypothetical protein